MAGEDPEYCGWLRNQPCCAPGCKQGGARVVHHHTNGPTVSPDDPKSSKRKSIGGKRGKSQTAHDHFGMPLHVRCHKPDFHELRGPFFGWAHEQIQAWQDEQVTLHRQRYADERAPGGTSRRAERVGIDVVVAAREFCAERELGPQIEFDLKRLLRTVVDEAERGRAF